MIPVTRLNGSPLVVNADLILTVERTPDTLLSMLNGEKIAVKEPVDEVIKRVITFRRRIQFANVAQRTEE